MAPQAYVLRTARLGLRQLERADAPFILQLLNEPSWLQYIGDKGIRTTLDAERYVEEGPQRMYARFGFGLYLVASQARGEPMGLCGLLKRESLQDVDLGFAFLPRFWGQGYACESAQAVLAHAKSVLGIDRILAITSLNNHPSARLLQKLGFALEHTVRLPEDAEELLLYAHTTGHPSVCGCAPP